MTALKKMIELAQRIEKKLVITAQTKDIKNMEDAELMREEKLPSTQRVPFGRRPMSDPDFPVREPRDEDAKDREHNREVFQREYYGGKGLTRFPTFEDQLDQPRSERDVDQIAPEATHPDFELHEDELMKEDKLNPAWWDEEADPDPLHTLHMSKEHKKQQLRDKERAERYKAQQALLEAPPQPLPDNGMDARQKDIEQFKRLHHLAQLGQKMWTKYATIITAQMGMSATPDDIEKILTAKGLFGSNFDNTQVAPLLNTAGIPETVKIQTILRFTPGYHVLVIVKSDPAHAGVNRLKALLQAKFGAAVAQAVKDAKANIVGELDVKWSTFT